MSRLRLSLALALGPAVLACGPETHIGAQRVTPTAGDSAAVASPPEAALAARRVWAEPQLYLGLSTPSPDGRLLTSVDLHYGRLLVRELETGATRILTSDSTSGLDRKSVV